MELVLNRSGYLVSDTHRECVKCRKIYEITCKTNKRCKKCNCVRVKSSEPSYKMLARAKSRSKQSGLCFNIDIEDIIIPDYCPILGIELNVHEGKSGGKSGSPSLDRIDNSLGYIKGNVIVLSQLANAMKNSATGQNLIDFANWVFKTYSNPRTILTTLSEYN